MRTTTAHGNSLILLTALASSLAVVAAANSAELKPGQFIRNWTILGPIDAFEPDGPRTADAARKKRFDVDLLKDAGGEAAVKAVPGEEVSVFEKPLQWKRVESADDEVDLEKAVGEHEWSIAYAAADVEVAEATSGMLGIGSDDAVRVWLNGELVHDNWAGRSLSKDDDLVAVKLKAGTNRLLLKVLNRKFDWGFTCRLLSPTQLGKKMVVAGVTGKLEQIKQLLAAGVDVNATNDQGLTAYQAAKIRGYEAVATWLAENGADIERSFADPSVLADAILTEESRPNQPGVAVLVSRGGEVLFSGGYGLADVKGEVPITSNTKFRIGSVTKQFTAAAILKLQEDGKLSVKDTLDKFIPDYPRGDEVTIHHLLTHTSGIRSYTSKPDFMEKVTKPIEPAELMASFKQDDFDFDPGQKWSYSNSGYFLLGHIVSKVSGKSYGDYLQETFFEPLGMKQSGVHRPDLGLEQEALGYSYEDGEFEDALDWHMSHAGGAGAIYSTVEDLQRWNAGVFGGQILSQESLAAAFTKAEPKDGSNLAGYGYGWMIGEQRGLKTISHSGGLQGFVSHLTRFPDQQLTVAVLHNAFPNNGELEPAGLAGLIAEVYLWKEMKPRTTQEVDSSVDPKSYTALVGRYDYGGAVLVVTTEDNRLFAQLTGQQKFEIFPASPSKFFWRVVEAEVEFLRDVDDNVTAAQHTQGGRTFKAPKLKDEKVVKLDEDVLDSYVATYDFGGLAGKLVVTRKGNHLAAKLGSQPALDVFPKSKTTFFYKVIKAELEFVSNDDGQIAKVILRQGFLKLQGRRLD